MQPMRIPLIIVCRMISDEYIKGPFRAEQEEISL
jgi:hypothetical protein